MFKDHLLKGKRILITGGGTGLGKEIAARYAELGADLWLAGRRGGVLEDTARELTDNHDHTRADVQPSLSVPIACELHRRLAPWATEASRSRP